MSAREEVLARLRAARDAGAPRGGVPPTPREYRRVGALAAGSAEVVDRLEETVTEYRAVVFRAAGPGDVPAVLASVLEGVGSVVVPPGLPTTWTDGLAVTVRRDDPPLSVPELDGLDAVLTGASVAIADTGTLVLAAGEPDQGRRAITLVPDHHVCVVDAAAVVSSVPEALARLDPTRPLTFVSGPSATSDIELDRVEGVHGPRRLDVVLVGPPRA
ncbi:LutC/YkgG family protein [Actinomycetospora cinnamomea]|uniref:LutC/YkgG family protein n=1 Tax=Actinomycetospora cinnamomea TaxID=663609 RepID=UPI000E3103B7|nr:LUD domain-containing protein [Actinomycetospora cinnamomea]